MKKRYFPIIIFSFILGNCSGNSDRSPGSDTDKKLSFSTDFESGSIGGISKIGQNIWSLRLKNDNNDASLPDTFRTWWNVKIEGIESQGAIFRFTGLGFPYFFVPVYSLNGQDWVHFPESAVKQIDDTTIEVTVTGEQDTLWIARTFPYTTKDYLRYRNQIAADPNVKITVLGNSPYKAFPIDMITIEDAASTYNKKHIWIHARTHSAEVGSSYLLEGLINTILSDDIIGNNLRQKYIFKIVPMHNADGILLGNYRTNATSINLENQWLFNKIGDPLFLKDTAPVENQFLNKGGMVPCVIDENNPVILALNLHSSNSRPDTKAFFFPHFGLDDKYTKEQQELWRKQINFIQSVAIHYDGRIEAPPLEGGSGFLNSYFPETWFWYNRQDLTTAITLETTYSKAGFDFWVTPKEWRELGVAVAKAIYDMDNEAKVKVCDDRSMFRFQSGLMSMEELEKLHHDH